MRGVDVKEPEFSSSEADEFRRLDLTGVTTRGSDKSSVSWCPKRADSVPRVAADGTDVRIEGRVFGGRGDSQRDQSPTVPEDCGFGSLV